jgi:hypothetical protein
MARRILRILLPTILVASGLGAVAWTWTLAQHVDQLEQTGRQSAARIDRLDTILDAIAHDELIYVASGQIDRETLTATSGRLREIVSESSWLLGQSLAGATSAAGAIASGVASLGDVDLRATENIRADLDLMAADLLFTETARTRQTLREQLRALRALESKAVAEARSVDLRQAWTALAAVALLFAYALVRSIRPAPRERSAPVSAEPQILNLVPQEMPSTPEPSIDLEKTAALCTAIGCLQGETGLQDLLARSATVLGASGVVVWMAAADDMFPVAAHGYDAKVWPQLGPINRSAQNAIGKAWRTVTLQTVAGDATNRAGIVAPLIGADRCFGVLALEVAPGREADGARQAIAKVIAAQLATVLVAWPAGSSLSLGEVVPFERAGTGT